MARRAREAEARANLAQGKAPPEAFELLREIKRRYRPTRELVLDLARAEAGKARSTGRWLGRYLGGFLERDPAEDGKPFAPDAAFQRAVNGAKLDYEARLCVAYADSGAPTVEVDGGSGVAALDRTARDIVVQAADRRRAGFSGAVRVCYRFSATLSRIPPLPVLACGLDQHFRPECVYPLKEIATTRVILDGVELGPATATATPATKEPRAP